MMTASLVHSVEQVKVVEGSEVCNFDIRYL